MSNPNPYQHLEQLDSQERYEYLVETALEQQEIWILSDNKGFVLLNSEDGDCLPIWPHKECAQQWVHGDWKACEPQSIDLNAWQTRWVPGLTEDQVVVAVFPNRQEEAIVVNPSDIDDDLSNAMSF
ncbi:DUF2750 domain-containing protein [Reinekea marina]|uniref:DUF2750 domain-containing protein n=1 Tax=Reinekea marina TaxID=1310421 RepID=A0ABV7WRT5_9GAMM|nr:DUF2750 domain-containing protein [Reinekea marina]MDN3651044.1 DUF2750 domain-containing protein [Reinekea marina]